MARVVLESRIRHPRYVLVLLQPARKRNRIAGMAFAAQAEGLEADEELLGSEGVQGASEVAEDLDADTDGERDGAEGLPELQAVVAL